MTPKRRPRERPARALRATAGQAGCAPVNCLVIEDSAIGVRGAVAAGMQCLGFASEGDGSHLIAEGAVPFHSMFDLPDLLRLAREATP